MASRRVGGGTSRLCMRAQPSIASMDEEPVPVTTILLFSVSGGARRNGDEDIRASPMCIVATVLGRLHPLLSSLAMSG